MHSVTGLMDWWQLGLGVTDEYFSQAQTVEQRHKKLIHYELPERFTYQHMVSYTPLIQFVHITVLQVATLAPLTNSPLSPN